MAQSHSEPVTTEQLLLHAASTGDTKLALAALDNGASPNCRDHQGNTPLMRAATYGKVEMVQLLVDAGADVDAATEHRVTALMKAAIHDRAAAAHKLLSVGADGSLQDCDGLTAKEIAVKLGNSAVAAVL
jgi:ankyrin repeat protein